MHSLHIHQTHTNNTYKQETTIPNTTDTCTHTRRHTDRHRHTQTGKGTDTQTQHRHRHRHTDTSPWWDPESSSPGLAPRPRASFFRLDRMNSVFPLPALPRPCEEKYDECLLDLPFIFLF